jgi:two-component system alkaline phosphatase synthesis response regulator PhoP
VPNEKILLIEDEPQTLHMLARSVEKAGYQVLTAANGEDGLRLARSEAPALVVLDLILPDTNGLEICRALRESPDTEGVLLIMVTAMGDQDDKIHGFELGADDYMVKPVDVNELLARILALLRRRPRPGVGDGDAAVLALDGFTIDSRRLCVHKGDARVQLTALEFKLLYQLASQPDQTFSRAALQELVWSGDQANSARTVDVLVNRLRTKLARLEGGAGLVRTIRRLGYRFRG